ncbi:MAG: xanthine dehydrogenase family protein molybdopterin-binding subunit [Methylobacter sp.]|nr:xanthine dehydrogenase family protein molybdopterin-binding subunit [Methylobacter sp.]
MNNVRTIQETVVRFAPGKDHDSLMHKPGYAGKPFSRVDANLKVKGEALFSADFKVENPAFAALVYSTITKGRITTIDTSEAASSSGVLAVITHENAPKIPTPPVFDPTGESKGTAASDSPVLQDNRIYRDSQPIAIVIAATLDQAEYAGTLVKVDYETEIATVSFAACKPEAVTPSDVLGEEPEVKIGNAGTAFSEAEATTDNIYRTPRYNHNAIEPHATIAVWNEDDSLLVYDPPQNLYGVKHTLAILFGLAPEKVRVVSPFVGGGFGGKGTLWDNTMLCVIAAKTVKRPIKLVISRAGVFRLAGGRTLSEQRVALGAKKDGRLTALIHSGITAMSKHNNFPEQFTFPARHLYSPKNIFAGQKVVKLDTIANTFMRAPGESIGAFALELAMDELAYSLKMDPIELRRINEPKTDPAKNTAFSSRHLIEAYTLGAEKFNWQKRHAEPRGQRDGKWLVGQGVATAYYPVLRLPATAGIRINADGTAFVKAAAHEMGMGTATVQIQHAAEKLGLPLDKVSFQYGDSDLPESPIAGGSNQTVSIVASVTAAAEKIHKELLALAGRNADSPLSNLTYEQIEARNNGLFSKTDAPEGETYMSILKHAGKDHIKVNASSEMPTELKQYSMHSYGAQFCEVRVNEETGETRVSRWLGSFDCGIILNPKTAISQFRGGIIMGIGMALTEETLFDERKGRIMNPSLAEYHIPVNLDVPYIDIIYNNIPDAHTPIGAHGIGEIGITGVAAAIANAVFNATGKRVRDLPITLDKLL